MGWKTGSSSRSAASFSKMTFSPWSPRHPRSRPWPLLRPKARNRLPRVSVRHGAERPTLDSFPTCAAPCPALPHNDGTLSSVRALPSRAGTHSSSHVRWDLHQPIGKSASSPIHTVFEEWMEGPNSFKADLWYGQPLLPLGYCEVPSNCCRARCRDYSPLAESGTPLIEAYIKNKIQAHILNILIFKLFMAILNLPFWI